MVKVLSIVFMLIAFHGLSYVLSENADLFDALFNAFETFNNADIDGALDGDMRKQCSGFDRNSSTVMDTYNYTKKITPFPDLNFAHAQAEAFTLTIVYRVMKNDELFFNISDFPRAYIMKFPPKLPIMCYHTWRALTKNKWQFSRKPLHSIFDRQTDIDKKEKDVREEEEVETLKTETHAQRFVAYMAQRKTLVDSMKILEAEGDGASKKSALQNSCSNVAKITPFNIGTDAKDVLSWLSPNFDRKRFNAMVKMFIGDVIMFEILEQACRAASPTESQPAQAKHLEWDKAHELLIKADQYLKANWNNTMGKNQLEEDVKAHPINNANTKQAIDKGELHTKLTTYLNDKYHWLAFRAHFYLNNKFDDIGACKGTNMRCVKEKGILIVVRWKDIYSDNITADAIREQAVVQITQIVRNNNEFPDDRAKAEKVTGVVNDGLTGMFAGLRKLTTGKERLDIDTSGKLIKVSTDALVKMSKTFKSALKVLSTVGKFLGPFVGSLCAVLSMFEEDGTSAILSKIDEGFKQMHGRFDQIEQGMADMRKHLEKHIDKTVAFHDAFAAYRGTVINPLQKLRNKFERDGGLSLNPFAGKDEQKEQIRLMREACNDKDIDPVIIMSAMHDHMTKCTTTGITFCDTVVAWAIENRAKLQGMLLSRAAELAALVEYNTKCAAYKSNSNTFAKIEYDTSVVMRQAAEIQRSLAHLDNEQLYAWPSTVQITLETEYKNKLINGELKSVAKEIATGLQNKYNWNDFLVIAFRNYETKETTHNVDGQPQFMTHFIYNDDNSVVYKQPGTSPDIAYYAIVTWALLNETDSTDDYLKWIPDIEGKGNGRTTLCSTSFDKQVKNVANGEDVKSMFIFRRFAGHFWYYTNENYDPIKFHDASDTGFAMGGSLIGRSRGEQCWYKTTDYYYNAAAMRHDYKYHRIFLHFVGNVGGGY